MPRTILACALAVASLVLGARLAPGQPVTGTVRGVEAINVRRGPSAETAAFAVLHRGARVVIDEQAGEWVRVVLASGENGWVNAAFLDLSPGATVAPAPTVAAAAPVGSALPPSIDTELARLRQRLASLESVVAPTVVATPVAVAPDSKAAAPALVPSLPTVAVVTSSDTFDVGPALALAGVCFVVGFLLGTFYGQRQERRGRSRVRF